MKRVTWGNCGLRTTQLVFGTLCMGKLQSKLSPQEGAPVIVRGIELGIDCIDTAQLYGTYEHIALALKELGRDAEGVAIISKSHARTAQDMLDAVDEARRVMHRDVLDGFDLHGVRSREDFDARRPAFDTLVRLKAQGVIRAIGLSVHCLAGLEPAYDCPDVDIVMPSVNSKGLGVTDGSLQDMLAACRRLKEKGRGVYAMKPLAGGHLHASVVEALNFVRSLKEVDAVAVGMKTIPELEMNVAVFSDCPVPDELLQRVNARPKNLLIYPICEGCGKCVKNCLQDAITIRDDKAVVDPEKCVLCGYCAEECPNMAIRVV